MIADPVIMKKSPQKCLKKAKIYTLEKKKDTLGETILSLIKRLQLKMSFIQRCTLLSVNG